MAKKRPGPLSKTEKYLKDFWHGRRDADKHEAAAALIETAKAVKDMNAPRIEQMKKNTAMYRERDCNGFMPGDLFLDAKKTFEPLRYNVIMSCTDTALAKLTLHKPMANFSTFGADMELKEAAKVTEKLNVGALQADEGYKTARAVMKDAMLCPVGVVKTFEEHHGGDKHAIRYRRVHPSKVLWDIEATVDNRRPRTFYEFDERGRASLLEQFAYEGHPQREKNLEAILNAPHVTVRGAASRGKRIRDLVEVFEGYREGRHGQPGKHIIAIKSQSKGQNGYALLCEDWEGAAPYSFVRWSEDELGFDGLSIAHILRGIQEEIDFVLEHLRDNHQSNSRPYFLKPLTSDVDDDAFMSDAPHRLVKYTGTKPEIVMPDIASPQVFQYLEQLYNRAFELVGLSQLSATSKKPADLESGAALRTYLDVETVRFSVPQDSYEQLFVDLGRQTARCARRIQKKFPGWWVGYVGNDRMMQKVNVADALLDENKFQVRIHPISSLPLQPSARLDRVAEMARDQLITPSEFKYLANAPDLEDFVQLDNAPYEDLKAMFEAMLNPKRTTDPSDYERLAPREYMELSVGIKLATSFRARAAVDGADDWRLQMLEDWIIEAETLEQDKLQSQLAIQQLELQKAQMEQELQAIQGAAAGAAPPMGPPPAGGPEQPPGGPGAGAPMPPQPPM